VKQEVNAEDTLVRGCCMKFEKRKPCVTVCVVGKWDKEVV